MSDSSSHRTPENNHYYRVWFQSLPNYYFFFIRSGVKKKIWSLSLQVFILSEVPPVELTCLSQSRSYRRGEKLAQLISDLE